MTSGRAVLLATLSLGILSNPIAAEGLPEPPVGVSLVDCQLGRIDFKTMKPEDEKHRFVMLVGAPQGRGHAIDDPAQLRVYDPSNLLMGRVFESAQYSANPATLVARTDSNQGAFFRFAVSLEKSAGALGLNGKGSEKDQEAHSYMGDCTVSTGADVVARYEALGTAQ